MSASDPTPNAEDEIESKFDEVPDEAEVEAVAVNKEYEEDGREEKVLLAQRCYT